MNPAVSHDSDAPNSIPQVSSCPPHPLAASGANGRYDDIIDLPHHRSRTRPPMSAHNRAAQFIPFAALTGFDAVLAAVEASHPTRS